MSKLNNQDSSLLRSFGRDSSQPLEVMTLSFFSYLAHVISQTLALCALERIIQSLFHYFTRSKGLFLTIEQVSLICAYSQKMLRIFNFLKKTGMISAKGQFGWWITSWGYLRSFKVNWGHLRSLEVIKNKMSLTSNDLEWRPEMSQSNGFALQWFFGFDL